MKLQDRLNSERLLALTYQALNTRKREPKPSELLVEAIGLWWQIQNIWFAELAELVAVRWRPLLLARHEDCFARVAAVDARYYRDVVCSGDDLDEDETVLLAAYCLVNRLFWRLLNSCVISEIEMTTEQAAQWMEQHRLEIPEVGGQMRMFAEA
mgnify:CR=1 FL=1